MIDHRAAFASHFRSHIRRRYHSSEFKSGSWVQGACERYAVDANIDLDIVVGVANGEREPNIKILADMGIEEAWITEKETVSFDRKVYRTREGDRLY